MAGKNSASPKDKEWERKKRSRSLALVVLAILFMFALLLVRPVFVVKPFLEKPELASAEDINSNHINWMLNEGGAYRLHPPDFLGDNNPEIEVFVTDQNRRFTTTVINNFPATAEIPASDPDVRFRIASGDLFELYNSTNFLERAVEMRKEGKISVELLKTESAPAAKGYRDVYLSLPA